MALTETAFAKINLALHVTGQRADGYHLLDTLVTFAGIGDQLTFALAAADRFTLSGPFSASLAHDAEPSGNLAIRARDALRARLEPKGRLCPPVHIHLVKNLPVSSGIGGGSADAAATLRGLCRLWNAPLAASELQALALPLGADVPMCLVSRPLVARGIGEALTPVALPPLHMLLVNPLVPVSTPAIFRLLTQKDNPPLPDGIETLRADTLARIAPLRNDLQPPAERLEPIIASLVAELAGTGAAVSRMSGSGATCFGLFETQEALDRACSAITTAHPAWFAAAIRTFS